MLARTWIAVLCSPRASHDPPKQYSNTEWRQPVARLVTLAIVISLFALFFTAEEAAGDTGVLGASAGLVLLLAAAALVAMAVKR